MTEKDLTYVILLFGLAGSTFASPWFHPQDVKEGNAGRIRHSETVSSAVVVSTGFALSVMSKSKTPFVAAVIISVMYICSYEYMMKYASEVER